MAKQQAEAVEKPKKAKEAEKPAEEVKEEVLLTRWMTNDYD